MGRDRWSNRRTVEQCRTIDIFDILRTEVPGSGSISLGDQLKKAHMESIEISLSYTITDPLSNENIPICLPIELTATSCNFGGLRYWLICPLERCVRRVGKLYLPPGEKHFGCRHCYNLTYKSCKEHDKTLDAIMRDPELLISMVQSSSPRRVLLATKAYHKITQKLLKL